MHDQNHPSDLSGPADRSPTVARLEARLAREKAARLEAEAIAEKVASDRWELRQQLQDKLDLRTSELEAARRAAARAMKEQERFAAAVSHEFRTTLAALVFLAGSLSPEKPPSAQQLDDLSDLLSHLRAFMDDQMAVPTVTGDEGADDSDTATHPGSRSEVPLVDVISANEDIWHQIAARSGKLLMLEIGNQAGKLTARAAKDLNQAVITFISDRCEASEPVIELHLEFGPNGFELT